VPARSSRATRSIRMIVSSSARSTLMPPSSARSRAYLGRRR
jgi:hypothetical protein